MKDEYTARVSKRIETPVDRVWEALTTPALIKQYFYGTEVVTDWKEGSSILYKGQWEGRAFEYKGRIIRFDPEKSLVSTHWSPLSGVPDRPENYHTVHYELEDEGGATRVTVTQDNNASQEEKNESEKNWDMMLEGLKILMEGGPPQE